MDKAYVIAKFVHLSSSGFVAVFTDSLNGIRELACKHIEVFCVARAILSMVARPIKYNVQPAIPS
jgi:hypothetical protein